jgi:hypothetical protein
MMRRCTRLNANEARRKLLEERQDIAALALAANEHVLCCVDAMNLKKNRLGDVETDRRHPLHARLPAPGRPIGDRSMPLTWRWTSTRASKAIKLLG